MRESKKREGEEKIKCQGSHGSIVILWRGEGGGGEVGVGGCLNLGNRPGKSTGVHKFTVALLGPCAHTLSLTHITLISYSKTTFSFITTRDRVKGEKK